ncbi:MAG: hypothetical protein ACE5RK_02705 [Candidatus Nitrosomaritimum aestuariumsis]
MTSLLEDVNRMLANEYGDIPRLKEIKETLEQNKMLFVSERKYLVKLTRDHPEAPAVRVNSYDKPTTKYSTDEDLDIDELEEKIKVESEPS